MSALCSSVRVRCPSTACGGRQPPGHAGQSPPLRRWPPVSGPCPALALSALLLAISPPPSGFSVHWEVFIRLYPPNVWPPPGTFSRGTSLAGGRESALRSACCWAPSCSTSRWGANYAAQLHEALRGPLSGATSSVRPCSQAGRADGACPGRDSSCWLSLARPGVLFGVTPLSACHLPPQSAPVAYRLSLLHLPPVVPAQPRPLRAHTHTQTSSTHHTPARPVRHWPQVPFLFKYTVDSLAADPSALTPAAVAGVLALTPPALIVGYGVARAGASFCNEARNAVFAQVGWGGGGCGDLGSGGWRVRGGGRGGADLAAHAHG